MCDPYLYENTEVLKNKLDIRTQDGLNDAEADYVVYRLKELAMNPLPGEYNTEHLLRMHHYIFRIYMNGQENHVSLLSIRRKMSSEVCQ